MAEKKKPAEDATPGPLRISRCKKPMYEGGPRPVHLVRLVVNGKFVGGPAPDIICKLRTPRWTRALVNGVSQVWLPGNCYVLRREAEADVVEGVENRPLVTISYWPTIGGSVEPTSRIREIRRTLNGYLHSLAGPAVMHFPETTDGSYVREWYFHGVLLGSVTTPAPFSHGLHSISILRGLRRFPMPVMEMPAGSAFHVRKDTGAQRGHVEWAYAWTKGHNLPIHANEAVMMQHWDEYVSSNDPITVDVERIELRHESRFTASRAAMAAAEARKARSPEAVRRLRFAHWVAEGLAGNYAARSTERSHHCNDAFWQAVDTEIEASATRTRAAEARVLLLEPARCTNLQHVMAVLDERGDAGDVPAHPLVVYGEPYLRTDAGGNTTRVFYDPRRNRRPDGSFEGTPPPIHEVRVFEKGLLHRTIGPAVVHMGLLPGESTWREWWYKGVFLGRVVVLPAIRLYRLDAETPGVLVIRLYEVEEHVLAWTATPGVDFTGTLHPTSWTWTASTFDVTEMLMPAYGDLGVPRHPTTLRRGGVIEASRLGPAAEVPAPYTSHRARAIDAHEDIGECGACISCCPRFLFLCSCSSRAQLYEEAPPRQTQWGWGRPPQARPGYNRQRAAGHCRILAEIYGLPRRGRPRRRAG